MSAPSFIGVERNDERVERLLTELMQPADEARFDGAWREAQAHVRALALRPAKRLRPRLVQLGFMLARGEAPPEPLWRFAAGLELLHTFLLIHDDVADRSELRRGGPTLQRLLRAHGPGDELAVVAGDHLFARALELMVSTALPAASRATHYYLGICRHTAVGQYLDLSFSARPLSSVSTLEALRVADLKTAKYSFGAPLACGSLLAGASAPYNAALERVGRFAGLAFQLRDDLLGIFGEEALVGKPGSADLTCGKRTLPMIAAYRRASPAERALLERLGPRTTREGCAMAQEIIRARGGVAVTERAIARTRAAALRALEALAPAGPAAEALGALICRLSDGPLPTRQPEAASG
jgi:geranylgeranyl diphosphate synthase, type I